MPIICEPSAKVMASPSWATTAIRRRRRTSRGIGSGWVVARWVVATWLMRRIYQQAPCQTWSMVMSIAERSSTRDRDFFANRGEARRVIMAPGRSAAALQEWRDSDAGDRTAPGDRAASDGGRGVRIFLREASPGTAQREGHRATAGSGTSRVQGPDGDRNTRAIADG